MEAFDDNESNLTSTLETSNCHHIKPPQKNTNKKMVGATGFEPATSWPQTKRSTRLSYAPLQEDIITGIILTASFHPINLQSCSVLNIA